MESGKSDEPLRPGILLFFWTVVAGVSVAQGFLNSIKPGQSQDLHLVYRWFVTWLWQGVSPYYLPTGLTANYPPHAIAFLSPLALIPEGAVALVWGIINVALAPIAALIAFRYVKPEARKKAALLPCVMFLSWAGLRIGLGNGQFSLLMMSFGLLAVLTISRRPYLGGIFLALALMKPHIGAAFFLWAVLTKQIRAIAVCAGIIVLGWLLFSIRAGENPLVVAQALLSVLRLQFGGATFLGGDLELRPLVHAFIPADSAAELVHLAILLAALIAVCLVGLKRSPLARAQKDVLVLQLSCMWVLMSVFHNPYDSILMLPVMVGLQSMSSPRQAAASVLRFDLLMLWILQIALVINVPGIWWRLSNHVASPILVWVGSALSHFDRVIVAAFFIYLLYRVRTLCRIVNHEAVKATPILRQSPAANT